MFDLTGKSAVVTGGGSGIGESTAHALADVGATVFILDRDAVAGQRVASQIRDGQFVPCDLADPASIAAAARAVLGTTGGKLDILVNNAGIGHVGTALTTTAADLDRLHNVNVKGTMLVTQAFLPGMLEQKRGSIINLASIGGVVGIRDRLAYCATKFAVVGLTKCMALDHATEGVRFNAVCPGRVETPFVSARLAEYADPVVARQQMAATQAVGRMGRPDEIAAAILYLAADESAFVTGSTFVIDGGWSAGK
jgi:NAD(P)-dependent dehydrogenase (short-subunit alcohol dehydrogenase family)